jgi:hypothetical protein
MTDTLTRTTQRSVNGQAGPADRITIVGTAIVAAIVAAGAALLAIMVVVLITWAASPATSTSASSAASAVRTVGRVWLLAHRVTLGVPGGHVAIAPLGLLVLPASALVRAGRWTAQATGITDLRGAVGTGALIGGVYALLGSVIATVVTSEDVRPSSHQALVATACIGVLFASVGTVLGAGVVDDIRERIPERAQAVLFGGAVALAGVLAIGALLTLGALVMHPGGVISVGRSLHAGPVGAVALFLACLVYVPNAIVWGAAFALGPGFAVGEHTSVSPFGVHLAALPAFPLLGALPANGAPPLLAYPALAVPVLAGAAGGVLLIRRAPTDKLTQAATWGLAAGAVGGVAIAVLAAVSGGGAGPGRLATVGPSAWQVGLAAVLELAVGGAAGAVFAQRRVVTGTY